jgi:stage II sporulation protein AA (anti-sigma F factor antagonist)
MEFTTRQEKDVTIADLSGRLTAGAGDVVLRAQCQALLDRGVRSLVLNLAGIHMMDSSGLGELTAAKKAMRVAGGRLTLLNVGPEVRRVLEAANLLGAFEVYADEAAAVASFRT